MRLKSLLKRCAGRAIPKNRKQKLWSSPHNITTCKGGC
jgi:hypothetical protein